MRFRPSALASLRLRRVSGRLAYRITVPGADTTRGMARELALVVSPAALRVRRFTIYRRVAPPPDSPDGTPTAA